MPKMEPTLRSTSIRLEPSSGSYAMQSSPSGWRISSSSFSSLAMALIIGTLENSSAMIRSLLMSSLS